MKVTDTFCDRCCNKKEPEHSIEWRQISVTGAWMSAYVDLDICPTCYKDLKIEWERGFECTRFPAN